MLVSCARPSCLSSILKVFTHPWSPQRPDLFVIIDETSRLHIMVKVVGFVFLAPQAGTGDSMAEITHFYTYHAT